MNLRKTTWLTGLLGALVASQAQAAKLSLEQYLRQVENENGGARAATIQGEAGALRAREAEIPYAVNFFTTAQYTYDASIPAIPIFKYDSQQQGVLAAGFSKNFDFGLQAKVSYNLFSQSYTNPVPIPGIPITPYFTTSPKIEFTQSLWSNGFGALTRATENLQEASALASGYAASFQMKNLLSQAEMTYWRLALARQVRDVSQEAVDRAQKIYEWNVKRVHLQLADKSDELQTQALLQMRKLDLQSANDEVRSAQRAFNSARNISSEEVAEQINEIDTEMISSLKTPVRAETRDDVKAAEQQERASRANATISMERDSPVFNVFASAALNGRDQFFDISNHDIFYGDPTIRPTYVAGVTLSVPLSFGAMSDAKSGWTKEQQAASLSLERKRFEQDQSWQELGQRLADAKKHLDVSRKLELIQLDKLKHEKDRLTRGRSTTFQVLSFEAEYLGSQLTRIRDQAGVINIIALMKVFGDKI